MRRKEPREVQIHVKEFKKSTDWRDPPRPWMCAYVQLEGIAARVHAAQNIQWSGTERLRDLKITIISPSVIGKRE